MTQTASSPTLSCVILAGGQGKRMRSSLAKVYHPLLGRPMVEWVIGAAAGLKPETIVVVEGASPPIDLVQSGKVKTATQPLPKGTADALGQAHSQLGGVTGGILVLCGDTPLLESGFLEEFCRWAEGQKLAGAVVSVTLPNPGSYGRIVRNAAGAFERIVEARDAEAAQQRITEVNSGIYWFDSQRLWPALEDVQNNNVQSEYYLPDVLEVLSKQGGRVDTFKAEDPLLLFGVNSQAELAYAEAHLRARIVERHLECGVRLVDPQNTYIEPEVTIAGDTVIEPYTFLRGTTHIAVGAHIGPGADITDSQIGPGARVLYSTLLKARVGPDAQVGPYSYLRPGTVLEASSKAGAFTEIKNSTVGYSSKVPHLSYVGDTTIGREANLGAGTITANYDGKDKHTTEIGDGVFTGSNTVFVAPVKVGKGAVTGAGSVITDDIPPDGLGIARARQRNIEDYRRRKEAVKVQKTQEQEKKP